MGMTLFLLALSGHRLWFLWLHPASILRSVRERVARVHPTVRYAANCSMCSSVWVAGAVVAFWALGWPLRGVVWVLAVSEMMAAIDTVNALTDGWRVRRYASRPAPASADVNGH